MKKIVKIMVLSLSIFLLLNSFYGIQAREAPPEDIARGKARFFLNAISSRTWENIEYVQFSYDLYLKKFPLSLNLKAVADIEKNGKIYTATFKIIEIHGVYFKDKVMLPFCKAFSSDLRNILKIELIEEMRIKDCKFVTNRLEQRTAGEDLEVEFSNNQIMLSGKGKKEEIITAPRKGRVGPLATLFNYIFFHQEGELLKLAAGVRNDEWLVLNKLSNLLGDDFNVNSFCGGKIPERLKIDFEAVKLERNETKKYPDFDWVALFKGEQGKEKNFLGLAKPFFFNVAQEGNLRLPYVVIISSVVNPKKKISRLVDLQRMYPDRKINKSEIEDCVEAENIIVYFTGYSFQK